MLAGVLFSRRDAIIVSTASLWSGLILLVSHMAWMNPRITTLPPVLKSYWLIVHVSVITSSYGFFSLSMLLGFVTLWMYMCITQRSTGISEYSIQKLTWTNERVLTIGLVLVTVGNLFGAVWANESWGRYWGWDPKETWTLITILVYAALLHIRLIPGLKKMYFFNVAALLAFPTILMTYLGVNFYLSGLHSYASGEPIPVPGWMVMIGFILCSVIGIAFPNRKLSFEKKG
jgi:cytochrome c-type biogenesis protein CcsB